MLTRPTHTPSRACWQRGCGQDTCRRAHQRYLKQWRVDRHRGQHRRVEAAPAQQHVRVLLAAGWMVGEIARAAGVTRQLISRLAAEDRAQVRADHSHRVLAVTGPAPQHRDINAIGTVRRLRALMAMGHPLATVARETGLSAGRLSVIANGQRPHVRAATGEAVRAAYRRLVLTPGTSSRSRTWASRRGWHGPAAWDDIDDPTAAPDPDVVSQGPVTWRERGEITTTEVLHLARAGTPDHEIAARVGCTLGWVRKVTAEWGLTA